jgi:hypothetical protein
MKSSRILDARELIDTEDRAAGRAAFIVVMEVRNVLSPAAGEGMRAGRRSFPSSPDRS